MHGPSYIPYPEDQDFVELREVESGLTVTIPYLNGEHGGNLEF